ncbi:hypothetical protein CISG_06276 [Coccidioides immitis RMSCC 3703]|uniref:Putative 5'-nucleotidase C-terminal domain-containing protein n=1 Tax=Coccidioides immitis RMSCC 3703 TaxID=454286 RepID=A0A0J8QX73_COCIT|nr:hypothetical protein CISG_06276 [Coccidioides immitis RMSCC 3703]
MLKSLTAVLVGLAGSVLGTQPNAPDPIPAPLRNLTWGQLNFLHTTDTHGWLAGHLNEIYGCSPENLWMSRAKYPSQSSIYTWLEEKVLPDTLRGDRPAMAILNTGAIRFDLFKGRVTEESAYNLSPFTGGFRFTKNVPYDKSIKILEVLNKAPRIFSQQPGVPSSALLVSPEQLATSGDIKSPLRHNQVPFEVSDFSSHEMDLIPGYTTQDAAGNDGDDTIHSPICFYRLPNCIQAFIPVVKEEKRTVKPDTVDLVYLEFIEPFIDVAAKFVGLDFDVKRDTAEYKPGSSLRSIIVDWVEHNWKCEG